MCKYFSIFLWLTTLFEIFPCSASLSISSKDLQTIGEKIWSNECGRKIEGLTHWNEGEGFGSFGIGHFIWYPVGKAECFQEAFPQLIHFLQEQGVSLPSWLVEAKGCPWQTRDEFYGAIHSPQMQELRSLLYETRDLQALFIALRLEKTFPDAINVLPPDQQQRVNTAFRRLASTPKGLYALIDYSNFKGMGNSVKESYHNERWGLLQVLQQMADGSANPLVNFVAAAKQVLIERVKNAPPERHEERWLKGWLNRVEGYL